MSSKAPKSTQLDIPLRKSVCVGIIATRWNAQVVDQLVEGARETCAEAGVESKIYRVPGAFELPLMAWNLTQISHRGSLMWLKFSAIVALGAIIRGETSHCDVLAAECARGLGEVALKSSVPVAFGVLTTDTEEQALARAGGKHGNKGAEAAHSALEMLGALRHSWEL